LEEVDTAKIGICGYSMPAFQSFPVFQRRSDLKCYVGGALSADLDTIVGYWVKHGRPTFIPKDYTKDLYPMNVAEKITKPCLLIVGELDEITPAKMVVQDIYNKLKGEKEIWIIKGVGHGAQWYNKDSFHNYVNRMVVFYDKYLK
jgi:pimeloyl-ACP methyl ester carboxylesterase